MSDALLNAPIHVCSDGTSVAFMLAAGFAVLGIGSIFSISRRNRRSAEAFAGPVGTQSPAAALE